MRIIVIRKLVTAIVLFGILAACTPAEPTQDPGVTLAQYEEGINKYNQITSGMTYDNIVQIMGVPGEEPTPAALSTGQPASPAAGTFIWNFNPDGFMIHAVFINDGTIFIKGFTWSSEAIMPKTNGRTTVAKYGQINVGMTYEEVVSILGSPGVLWSSRKLYRTVGQSPKEEIFAWWPEDKLEDPPLHIMVINFLDGMVASKE
jgi:outer membrane protein assembly factor BamE (lipoprotein component of BamABCDE complex)